MTAPVVARLNVVSYGGFSVGSTSDYHLHGVTISEQDYTSITVAFQVFVNHDTLATFVGYCTALEAAFRKPNGALSVTMNGTTWLNLSHTSNTGMLATPSIVKRGGGADSNNSRIYDCSVTVMRPADESGKDGRRSSSVTLAQDGSEIYTLDVSAEYTALSTNSALAQAQSAFPTYTAALMSSAGGTWDEYRGVSYSHDSDNKLCSASASYRQIVSAQSQVGTNDTTLQGVWSEVTTDVVGVAADIGSSNPLVKITVRLGCSVRSSVSTDLRDVYDTLVRPHMIALARVYSDTGRVSAILDRPGLRPEDNSINARMVFIAQGSSWLVRADTNVAMVEKKPYYFEPVLDGDDHSVDKHWRPGFIGAVVASTVLIVGSVQPYEEHPDVFTEYYAHIRRLKREKFEITEIQEPVRKTFDFPGASGTDSITMTALSRVTVMRLAHLSGGGGLTPDRSTPGYIRVR